MKAGRPERLASAIRQEVARMLLTESKDPGLLGLVVTGARVSADLRIAWLSYELRDDTDEGRARAKDALGRASGYLRHEIMRRLSLRLLPDLRFEYDDRMRVVEKLAAVMRDIPPDDPDGAKEGS